MNKFQNAHLAKEEERAEVRGRGGESGGKRWGQARMIINF